MWYNSTDRVIKGLKILILLEHGQLATSMNTAREYILTGSDLGTATATWLVAGGEIPALVLVILQKHGMVLLGQK